MFPNRRRIVLAGSGLIPSERQATWLPFIESDAFQASPAGIHQGFVHGHVPCALTGSVVDQSNHFTLITSFCDTRPHR
jgi:hypothetical protein